MLFNARKMLTYVGQDTGPLVVACPTCQTITSEPSWWWQLQRQAVSVRCECGERFTIPKFDPDLAMWDVTYGTRAVVVADFPEVETIEEYRASLGRRVYRAQKTGGMTV